MNFEELDRRMRVFETAHDHCVLPGLYMVARLDGRDFTRLTKAVHPFESPFDERLRDYMTATTEHLMTCGFGVVYGYTQSDEQTFGRKLREYDSILAGEASARYSVLLGAIGCFDCRISQLPTADQVVDYFRWRQEDAHRNALNAHCYWALRKTGQTVKEATQALVGLSVADKNELLYRHGLNFNDLPGWQKRGSGLYWETYTKPAHNPLTGEAVQSVRRRIRCDLELPVRDAYTAFVQGLVEQATSA